MSVPDLSVLVIVCVLLFDLRWEHATNLSHVEVVLCEEVIACTPEQ